MLHQIDESENYKTSPDVVTFSALIEAINGSKPEFCDLANIREGKRGLMIDSVIRESKRGLMIVSVQKFSLLECKANLITREKKRKRKVVDI